MGRNDNRQEECQRLNKKETVSLRFSQEGGEKCGFFYFLL
jgi:hypothetical protein